MDRIVLDNDRRQPETSDKRRKSYTTLEAAVLTASNLAGLDYSDVCSMTDDQGIERITEGTYYRNGGKWNKLIKDLYTQNITPREFKRRMKTELNRTEVNYASAKV